MVLTCKSGRRAYPVGFRRDKNAECEKKGEETGKSWAHQIDKDFRVSECSAAYPMQK